MFTTRKRWLLGIAASALIVGCTPGGFMQPGAANPPANKVLAAKLGAADGGPQAYVEFDDDDGHRQFEVEITGGQPGASFDVSINGMVVLSVMLDESGNAHLQFDSNPDGSGETQLPMAFPAAGAGDSVGVGELSGNFQEEDGEFGDHDDGQDADHDDDADANHDDDAVDNLDDGAVGDHHDGEDADSDDGADADSDDGAVDDHEEGDVDNADETEVEDVDDGEVEDAPGAP